MKLPRRYIVLKGLLMFAFVVGVVLAMSQTPPAGLTGSFGQDTCAICHNCSDTVLCEVDEGRALGGAFEILGLPEQYTPGETYTITVQINQLGQSRWGFELASRFPDSLAQAGTITATDTDRTQIQVLDEVDYIMHTGTGTDAGVADGPVQWTFDWTAPEGGDVQFGASGNAANNDGTASGDYIYTTQAFSSPAAASR